MKTTAEIVGITGIPRDKLYYLEDSGLVSSHKSQQGNREARSWNEEDVELIRRTWGYMSEGMRVRAAFERAKKELLTRSVAMQSGGSAKVFGFANQKGGVGKTSICFHLAGHFADEGKRVLVIDCDQQGNLSSALIDDIYGVRYTITDLFMHEADINDLIVPTRVAGVSLLPANLEFASIDMKLAGDKYADEILQQKLSTLVEPFDIVILDAPPSLGIATRAVLNATHDLVIPVECQKWSVIGTRHLDTAINLVKARSNPRLRLCGFVINKFASSRAVEQQYREMLRRRHGEIMFATELKNAVAYTEAVAKGLPITQYKPKSEDAEAIRRLAGEIMVRYESRRDLSDTRVA